MRMLGAPTATQTLLELDLTRGVREAPPGSPLEALRSRGTPALRDVVEGLRRGAADDRVVGLVAHVGADALTMAQAGELRDAVRRFAASGKPAVCWAEGFGELGPGTIPYWLATGFDEIWLQPTGDVGLVGMAADAVFLRGALDKLGVRTQIGQRHEYKTAANTFTQEGLTEPHREMATRLVESAVEVVVAGVAEGRGLSPDAVRSVIDEAPVPADRAVELGLVDHLGHRAEAMAAVRERVGAEARLRYADRYRKGPAGAASALVEKVTAARGGSAKVALVHASGPIVLGRGGSSPLSSGGVVGSDALGAALRAAGRDDDVKAVVLRVDSPGGSYAASDAIRHEVLQLRVGGTPVVASMGSVAGSGGYYIAMGADRVLAQPGTITGSIGVLAGKQIIGEALERVGVAVDGVSVGRYADMLSARRPFTDDELARLDRWLDRAYDDFTAKAAADRGMDVEQLRSLARGRVWTGADAVANGLVDQLGGLEDAIAEACRLASLDRSAATVEVLPRAGLLERLVPAESSDSPVAALVGEAARAVGLSSAEVALLVAAAGGGRGSAGALAMPVAWRLR